jgi:hypothetical protein
MACSGKNGLRGFEVSSMPRYWIDLFTWKTWQEFLKAGGTVSGFRERRWSTVQKMKPGDFLLCYLTGLSRFIGILEVADKPFLDETPIWGEAIFPARVPVRVVLELSPEHAVPVAALSTKLSYFQDMKSPSSWSGHFRGSPTEEKLQDAQVIIQALQDALHHPVHRDFDPKKLERKVPLFFTDKDNEAVTVPESVAETIRQTDKPVVKEETSHEEIQWLLLQLGNDMALDVWVARNDQSRSYNGNNFRKLPHLLKSLPRQFDEATNRTIELIDVLWLKEGAFVAAFEIEHTTSIYSGLLRLSDLISMQPNINIPLYIVAPDERREKVFTEINRPTFSRLKPPLREMCQYISYSELKNKVEQVRGFLKYLSPQFLDEIAESLEPDTL